jgi:hypothetical protein
MYRKHCNYIWSLILRDARNLQEVKEGRNHGLIYNPLIKSYYYRETAFAAKIFASDYMATGSLESKERAALCLDALKSVIGGGKIVRGLDEPVYTPRGVIWRKGSIPATILFLESIIESSQLLDKDYGWCRPFEYLKYLERCYIGGGIFDHDIVQDRGKVIQVINTSAIALYYINLCSSLGCKDEMLLGESKIITKRICGAICRDGFWPYLFPSIPQKWLYFISGFIRIPQRILRLYNRILGDSSVFFGDSLHQAVALFYLLKGMKVLGRDDVGALKSANMGWGFLKDKFGFDKNSGAFDFSWEQLPRQFRYSNFRDTSTYFYCLACLHLMRELDLISQALCGEYTCSIISYIRHELSNEKGSPGIHAYEGTENMLQYLIPRPSESVFNKGAPASDFFVQIISK